MNVVNETIRAPVSRIHHLIATRTFCTFDHMSMLRCTCGRCGFFVQVENIGSVLMSVRRRFHPVKARPYFFMLFALTSHTVLQLWLYRTSR